MKFLRRNGAIIALFTVSALAWGVTVSLIGLRGTNLWYLLIGALAWAATYTGEGDPLPERVATQRHILFVVWHFAPRARVELDHPPGTGIVELRLYVGWLALVPGYAWLLRRRLLRELNDRAALWLAFRVEVRQ